MKVVLCVFLLEYVLGGLSGLAHAQELHCDPNLIQPSNNPLGYRLREERCEGQYVQEVASTTLAIASFTQLFEPYNLAQDRTLEIIWPEFGDTHVQIRGRSLRWKLYYRMDSVRDIKEKGFTWPTDLLAAIQIPHKDLGMVGYTQHVFGTKTSQVYLPLSITTHTPSSSSDTYQLFLWPGVELEEVYVSLATVDADGRPKNFIQDGKALKYGYYPPQRHIEIPIPYPQTQGIYYVEIGALLQRGDAHTLDFLFFHAGS